MDGLGKRPRRVQLQQRRGLRGSPPRNDPDHLPESPPLFLYLRTDGLQAAASWETNGALRGAFSMHSFGESPSAAVESRLSQILQDNPPPKYYLSAKSCLGILNRAKRRRKELPEQLRLALERQAFSACKETG